MKEVNINTYYYYNAIPIAEVRVQYRGIQAKAFPNQTREFGQFWRTKTKEQASSCKSK